MIDNRILISDLLAQFSEKDTCIYSLCGRVVSKRKSSNYTFIDVRDVSGTIQAVIAKKDFFVTEPIIPGNYYRISGSCVETQTGEKSIQIRDIVKISYANKPLPPLIKDAKLIVKKRYLDIYTDVTLQHRLQIRSMVLSCLRSCLYERGFLEVDTPILIEKAIVGTADAFITRSNALKRDLYLRGSCEIKLKQLIAAGYEKIFELGQVFRNESASLIEFPLLEIQYAYANYLDMADLIEEVLQQVFSLVLNPQQEKEKWITGRWSRVTVTDAVMQNLGFDIWSLTLEELRKLGKEFHVPYHENVEFFRAQIVNVIIKKKIVPLLIDPTFLVDYPKLLSPLAKSKNSNSLIAERGYLFIEGQRICEIVSEENDPEKQRSAFRLQDILYNTDNHMHADLVNALEFGCPPFGGIGLNVNRLMSLITGTDRLNEVVFFPFGTSGLNK